MKEDGVKMRKEQILIVQRSCKIQKEITKVVAFYNKQPTIGFEFYHSTRVYKQKNDCGMKKNIFQACF